MDEPDRCDAHLGHLACRLDRLTSPGRLLRCHGAAQTAQAELPLRHVLAGHRTPATLHYCSSSTASFGRKKQPPTPRRAASFVTRDTAPDESAPVLRKPHIRRVRPAAFGLRERF